jgi:glycosyltransferase involved in cell wall biosynthesis
MVSVGICCYNEEKYLSITVDTVLRAAEEAGISDIDLIIVNDGSTDRTAEVIEQLKEKYPFIRPLHHGGNEGLGKSIRGAMEMANYDKLCFIPGDNDMSLQMIRDLFINRDKADVLITYFVNKEFRGKVRNIVSTLYQWFYMCVFNTYVLYLNGPGLYPTQKIRKLNLKSNRMSIHAELHVKLLCSGCTFYEVPGYMQTGLEGTYSLTWKNFFEVIKMYLWMVYEVKFKTRSFYNKTPVRIVDL